jgi:hypothetical protein
MSDRQHDPDDDDFDTYRRLILAELKRLDKECESHNELMRQHELKDKDTAKQVALDIQALQIRAEEKGRVAGEKSGATYGAGAGAIMASIGYAIVWVLQHWPT